MGQLRRLWLIIAVLASLAGAVGPGGAPLVGPLAHSARSSADGNERVSVAAAPATPIYVPAPRITTRSAGHWPADPVGPNAIYFGLPHYQLTFVYTDIVAWDAAHGSAWTPYLQNLLPTLAAAARLIYGPPMISGEVFVAAPNTALLAGVSPDSLAYDAKTQRLLIGQFPAPTPDGQPYPEFSGALLHEVLHAFHTGLIIAEPWLEEGLAGAAAAFVADYLWQSGGPDVIDRHTADLTARLDSLNTLGGDVLAGQTQPSHYPAPVYDLWRRAAAGAFYLLANSQPPPSAGEAPGAWLRALNARLALRATANGGVISRVVFLNAVAATATAPVDGGDATTWLTRQAFAATAGRAGVFLHATAWGYANLGGAPVDPFDRAQHPLASPHFAPPPAAGFGHYYEFWLLPLRRTSSNAPLELPGATFLLSIVDAQNRIVTGVTFRRPDGSAWPSGQITLPPNDTTLARVLINPTEFTAALSGAAQSIGAFQLKVSNFAGTWQTEPRIAFIVAGTPTNLSYTGGVSFVTLDANGRLSGGFATSLNSLAGVMGPTGLGAAHARLLPHPPVWTATPSVASVTSSGGFNGLINLPLPYTRVLPVQPSAGVVTLSHVALSPTTLAAGETLVVTATIQNASNSLITSQGPSPGFIYQEGQSATSLGYPSLPGARRLAVDYTNSQSGYPYRWGFPTLAPGAATIITGGIRLTTPITRDYSVALILESSNAAINPALTTLITVTAGSASAPTAPPGYYLSYYDANAFQNLDWLAVGAPPGNGQAAPTGVWLGATRVATHTAAAGAANLLNFPNLAGGLVRLAPSVNVPLIVSQRMKWPTAPGSFAEIPALPASALSDRWHTAWYDNVTTNGFEWIVAGNPLSVPTRVQTRVAGQLVGDVVVAPGELTLGHFPNVVGGPVETRGTLASTGEPAPIFVSQRGLWFNQTSFNEAPGIPASRLASRWLFTWYDTINTNGFEWLMVGNPSAIAAVTATVRVAGVARATTTVNPGAVGIVQVPNLMGGPVEVTAISAANLPAPIYATRRTYWGASFLEIAGLAAVEQSHDLWLPWFDANLSPNQTWLVIANPNDSPANYTITIAGAAVASGVLAANGVAVHLPLNVVGGPVNIRGVAANGSGAPLQLVASQRVLYHGKLAEVLARPAQ